MNFKTAVWRDPATETYCARIFPDFGTINLAAWGLTNGVEPVDVTASSLRGPQGLGTRIEVELNKLVPDFPMATFAPVFLGDQPRGVDIRALLESKLAAVAA